MITADLLQKYTISFSLRNMPNWSFFGGSGSKESARYVGPGFHPWVRQIPWRREQLPTPLQYSGLGNSMDREDWQATVYAVAKSRTRLHHFHAFTDEGRKV